MTDNEIRKALECCDYPTDDLCCECCFKGTGDCTGNLTKATIDLINRQKAEIERLEKALADSNKYLEEGIALAKQTPDMVISAVTEVVKEFAERLKAHTRKMSSSDFSGEFWDKAVLVSDIDNLVKEMVGED